MTDELDRLLELQDQSQVHAAVHGYRHLNHAPRGEKKTEFGADRPIALMTSEIAAAWEKVHTLFGDRAVPAFVAPWNRMTDEFYPQWSRLGLLAISRKAPRGPVEPRPGLTVTPGLAVVDVHLDIVDWWGTRGFIGDSEALTRLSDCLRARRLCRRSSPTGLLTHHAVMDEPAWGFLARLFAATGENRRARWLSAPEAFNLAV